MFLADNKTFSLDMINGLEAFVINKVIESNRFEVINTANPKVEIDEYDLSLIEEVYEEIEFILATQGYTLNKVANNVNENSDIFHLRSKKDNAFGTYQDNSFKVLSGSIINMDCVCRAEKMNKKREKLICSSDIVKENDKYVLKIPLIFNSPSSAASFVLGSSRNGWIEWIDDKGRTLKEVYQK